MDSQSPQSSHLQHEKVQIVAQELLKAFNSDSQSDSNIIIFLSKLYKNNSPLKNKKMKSIRLNQFINFLQHVVNDFPTTKQDTELLYCSVLSTLTNDKNFTDDEDYELIQSIGFEIAKVIEKLTESPFTNLGLRLLSYLINSQNICESMMEIPVFDEALKNSKYFQTISLDQSQNTHHHHTIHEDKWHILQQPPISTIILDSINVEKVYGSLFSLNEQKLKVVSLFYEHVKKLTRTQTKSKRELFIDCFITSHQKLSNCQVDAILKILQKQIFDRETINEVVSKITQQKVNLQDLIEIDFKNIKGVEEVFVQCLIQQSSKKAINELIELFLNMKSEENYFPLYLILKQNQKVPIEYVNLFFEENQLFTVRKGIIFALSIVDNEMNSFGKLMRCFMVWNGTERVRTRREYNCILKALHLSLQNLSKANVVSHILRNIHKQNLNKECRLQFISYNGLRVSRQQQMKGFINEQSRESLGILFRVLSEFEGMTKTGMDKIVCEQMKSIQWQHKYRMDLQFLLTSNPYIEQEMSSALKEMNKLLMDGAVSTQQLLKQLPQVKQHLLEVPLMWLNNKFQTFYQQETNQQTVDWAVKMYKKLSTDLGNQLKSLLEKEKLQPYYKLIKTLIDYTIEKQQPINVNVQHQGNKIFHQQIVHLINSAIDKQQRMNSNNFNDYFLTHSAYKHYLTHNNLHHPIGKHYRKIIWIKTLLIEIKSLIKNIVKAEKLSNRKEIKNIITDNVADVLAFKVIHEYFDAEIQEAPEILINVFRNIQPEMEFFEKTQALASSLNIEFYSIFEELPNLLENFNFDTLIFLSKLILNPKPSGEEKKKTSKKKKDKDNHPEDSICLTVITKNFELLFGNPNQMDSFKSLFVILRKLTDSEKINPQQLEKHLNNWLSQINFISCSNFQSWKNKVLSLSKMWKNAADLLNDKKIEKQFQLSVLEKHFNLFTDLLNKLYQNFREEPEFLEIQQRILLSLCLIYKKQDFSQIIEEQNSMVEFMIKRFQQRNMSRIVLQNKFYFCHQCKKNACYACSSFLHRNHDKNFIGKTGICEHEASNAHKSKKQTLLKPEYSTSVLGGVSAILKKNEDLPEEVLERISQKLLLDEQFKANEDGDFIGRFKDPQAMRQLLQGRIQRSKAERSEQLKRKIREKENFIKNQLKKEEEEKLEEDEKIITPEVEEYFQYKESYCKQFKKIHPQFMYQPPKIKKVVPKINTSPLARVFLRQLQENHFYNEENNEKSTQNATNQPVNIEQIKEIYQFFKNNNLKADNGRDYTFGRGRGGYGGGLNYGQNPRQNLNSHRRNVIACNKKYLLLPSNMSLMNLSMMKLREKLEKKIQNKEFNHVDQEKNFVCSPTVNLPFEMFELAFSNSPNNPCLAVVGCNQLCFYSINADGRFGRQMNPEFSRIDNIVKFSWINEKKNLFAIAFSNYIRIGGISSNNNIKPFSKAQIGKTIRDFDGYMNSRTYVLFILDTEGKLYYIDVDFKQGKSTAYSPQDRMITLKDQNGVIIKDEIYSVKSVDGNRLLISFPNGLVRIAQTSRESNTWTTKKFDLKKVMKMDSLLVLQALKIVKFDDESVTFGAIGRKLNAFESTKTRKCAGQLMIVTFNTENANLSSVYFTNEENIESYDMSVISSGQMTVVSLNDEGAVHMFKHGVDAENKQVVERINAVMDNGSIRAICMKLLASEFFFKVEQGGMLRNLQFKENKCISNAFAINNNNKSQIAIRESYAHSNFISGISFHVELPSSVTEYNIEEGEKEHQWVVELRVKLLESSYVFKCSSKQREIQLGLNIKESMELFAHENELKIMYEIVYNGDAVDVSKLTEKQKEQFVKVKNINIYGFQAKDLYTNNNINNLQSINYHSSPYHLAFRQLFNDWHTYQEYIKESFQQYLLNPYRHDFYNIDIKKLYKIRYDHSQSLTFKPDQINLLLKLQLLAQTLSCDKNYTKQNLQDYLVAYRRLLLSRQYPRRSLENSVYRVGYSLCQLYQKHVPVSIGHPYYGASMINLHIVVSAYQKWQERKNLLTFDKLCTALSNMIFTSAIDLHIILQCIPQLIIQLSEYFKQLITVQKQRQFSQQESQVSVTRTCSRYIGIVCEYYQVMKNKCIPKMEEKMLYLLEQVFGQCKSDMPKQLVMNPFLYLQSIFTFNEQIQLESSIDIYSIILQQQQLSIRNIQSQSFYMIDKKNKQINKKRLQQQKQQLQEVEVKVEEAQRLLRENSRWEAVIEDEKDMEEEENEMYMEIEEEFDDDEEELVADEVQHIDGIQGRKQQANNNKQQSLQNLAAQTTPLIQKDLQQTIANIILSHSHPQTKKLTITHYDFPFELAIALFRKQNYLNENNIYFYLGLLYNLLKIIQNNLKISFNKSKVLEFIETVDKRVENKEYSSLFIVLNFFVSPKYHKTINKECLVEKPQSTLGEHFANYYKLNITRFTQLLTQYNPIQTHPLTKLSQIMRFTKFQTKNELYNLRFIANLYLAFRLYGYSIKSQTSESQSENVKQELLFKLVKHKLPVLKNIMLYEKWQQELDRAKVLVGFEMIFSSQYQSQQKQKGIDMLYDCAHEKPEKFVQQLLKDQGKVNFLEEYSLQSAELNENTQTKILKLLEIYYNS